MEAVLAPICVGSMIGFVALLYSSSIGASARMLHKWANQKGYKILERRYLWWYFSRGPAFFQITIENRNGEKHTGRVRVGGWMFGLLADEVEVQWDNGIQHAKNP